MNDNTKTLETVAVMTTGKDLATAVLIVSVILNVTIFVTWLTITLSPAINVSVSTL